MLERAFSALRAATDALSWVTEVAEEDRDFMAGLMHDALEIDRYLHGGEKIGFFAYRIIGDELQVYAISHRWERYDPHMPAPRIWRKEPTIRQQTLKLAGRDPGVVAFYNINSWHDEMQCAVASGDPGSYLRKLANCHSKDAFKTWRKARKSARWLAKHKGGHRKAYRCDVCPWWHVTGLVPKELR